MFIEASLQRSVPQFSFSVYSSQFSVFGSHSSVFQSFSFSVFQFFSWHFSKVYFSAARCIACQRAATAPTAPTAVKVRPSPSPCPSPSPSPYPRSRGSVNASRVPSQAGHHCTALLASILKLQFRVSLCHCIHLLCQTQLAPFTRSALLIAGVVREVPLRVPIVV